MCKRPDMCEYRLLFGRPALRRKRLWRKIASVIWICAAFYGDFVAVIDKRDPARGEDPGECQLNPVDRCTSLVHKTKNVVIAEECDEIVWFRVHSVVCQHSRELTNRAAPRDGLAHLEVGREIEDG